MKLIHITIDECAHRAHETLEVVKNFVESIKEDSEIYDVKFLITDRSVKIDQYKLE